MPAKHLGVEFRVQGIALPSGFRVTVGGLNIAHISYSTEHHLLSRTEHISNLVFYTQSTIMVILRSGAEHKSCGLET